MRIALGLLFASLTACGSLSPRPGGYVVTSLTQNGSTLVATKCPTYSGRVDHNNCHQEPIGGSPVQASR